MGLFFRHFGCAGFPALGGGFGMALPEIFDELISFRVAPERVRILSIIWANKASKPVQVMSICSCVVDVQTRWLAAPKFSSRESGTSNTVD
jgi:hypothetical protein